LRPKLEADTEPADLEDDLVYADSDYRDLYFAAFDIEAKIRGRY